MITLSHSIFLLATLLGDVVQCGTLFGNVVQYKAEELITLSQNISPLATLLGDVVPVSYTHLTLPTKA